MFSRVWTFLRSVPAAVYAVAGWVLAVSFWTLSRAWKSKAQVREKQEGARVQLRQDFETIARTRDDTVKKATKTHEATEETIAEKEEELPEVTDLDSVADALNKSFGGE